MHRYDNGMCITSLIQCSVQFNGDGGVYTNERYSLGDPLSPYLFLLGAEGLSSMLIGAELRGELDRVKVCRDAPIVSHLLFMDDSLILMHADRKNAEKLKQILDLYCASSRQKLCEAKSNIYFSPNIDIDVKSEICLILNIMTVNH
jgi:hypothetical protein